MRAVRHFKTSPQRVFAACTLLLATGSPLVAAPDLSNGTEAAKTEAQFSAKAQAKPVMEPGDAEKALRDAKLFDRHAYLSVTITPAGFASVFMEKDNTEKPSDLKINSVLMAKTLSES